MRVRNRLSYLLLIAAVAALVPVRTVSAAAYTYSTRQRTINAGVLIVDAPGSGMQDLHNTGGAFVDTGMGYSDPDPYVFYILNQRSDIKPLGWNFINPLAAPSVTGDILTRWNARANNTAAGQTFLANNGGGAYQLYQRITPNMAPYWEVSLSRTGIDDLLNFDVLLLNLQGHTLSLTMDESEKLRRFVDSGGQLWI